MMLEQPTKIGNKTLYNVRVLNISVAKHYGLVKEYCEIVSQARDTNKQDLEKNGVQAELTLYFSVKKHLDQLVLQKLMKNKIQKFGAEKR
jgi:hypothetical protein|tara:strand:+ start:349 stop:618 length:270 start_codon:yes stop_codon:yes gene_type:complete